MCASDVIGALHCNDLFTACDYRQVGIGLIGAKFSSQLSCIKRIFDTVEKVFLAMKGLSLMALHDTKTNKQNENGSQYVTF